MSSHTPSFDLSLYLVLDPWLCAWHGIEATLEEAIDGGVTLVQWRAPRLSDADFERLGEKIHSITLRRGIPLIIDDRVEIARKIGAEGVHVGQKDMPIAKAREIMGENSIIGLSVSSLEELRLSRTDLADYLGVGPVFPTLSKPDAAPATGLELLRKIVAESRMRCAAIGGINAANAKGVMACGVEGVAVISAICGREDPAGAARSLLQAL